MKRSEIKALFPEATKDQIDSIMDLHGEGLEAIKGNYKDHVPKSELDTLNAKIAELEKAPKQEPTAEQLAELETLRKYKTDTETKVITEKKTTAIRKGLEALKAHPDAIDLLSLKFDLNSVELDDNGDIKGFAELSKPIQEAHSKFFGVEQVIGVTPGKAPAQTGGGQPGIETMEDAIRHDLKNNKK